MAEKFDVLIDMDGVLTQFDSAVESRIQEDLAGLPIIRPRKNFYIHEDYPEMYHGAIKGIWQAKDFFRNLAVVDGAVEGWKTVESCGVNPRICTSPIQGSISCIEEKKAWLEEFLAPTIGYQVIDNAIFDRDKARYRALALIDDKPEVPGANSGVWEHIVFDAPYNQNSRARLRLYGWRDPNLLSLIYRLRTAREED